MKKTVIDTNNRNFGLVTGAGFIIVFVFQLVNNQKDSIFILIFGAFLILLAFGRPAVLNKLRVAWIKVGSLLGIINTYLILSIIFFFIITPVGWLLRISRKIRLSLYWQKEQPSYWIREDGFAMDSFDKQF